MRSAAGRAVLAVGLRALRGMMLGSGEVEDKSRRYLSIVLHGVSVGLFMLGKPYTY